MNARMDIVIAGVGGQGTVLASRALAQAALNAGFTARTSETIGMAQREGSVQSHLRIDAAKQGPVIGSQMADVLIGFELAEAQRAAHLLKPSGLMLVNLSLIKPITVTLGTSNYPEAEINKYLSSLPVQLQLFDATRLAIAAGNFRTVNTVMLGALASTGLLPFNIITLLEALLGILPEKLRKVNQRAFESGSKALEEAKRDA